MAFDGSHQARSAPRRAKSGPVFCAGWRAYLNLPATTVGPVALASTGGEVAVDGLSDAQTVEILSWRPRSREGLLYQVRRIADGAEFWIEARYLRRQAAPDPTADASAGSPPR